MEKINIGDHASSQKLKEGTTIHLNLIQHAETFIDNPLVLFGLLFGLAVINIFIPPIPLETLTLFTGYLAGTGRGSITIIIAATVGGMFCGSFGLYLVVKKYGTQILHRIIFDRILIRNSYQKALQWFNKYGLWTVLLGKLVPGLSLCSVICCGILKLNPQKTALAFLLSNFIFFTILAMSGKMMGQNWGNALPGIKQYGTLVFLAIVIFTIGTGIYFFIKNNSRTEKE